MVKKKEVSQKIMKKLKEKAQLQSLEKEYSELKPESKIQPVTNITSELVEVSKSNSEGGIMVFLGKKVFGVQMWILLIISIDSN